MQEIRVNAEVELKAIIEKCTKMTELPGNKLKVPRVNARQIYGSNVELTTLEEYCRRTIFVPFMDGLIQQLNDRFNGTTKSAMSGIYLIPSLIENFPKSEIFEYFQSDLLSESSFSQEIQLWKRIMKNMKEIFPNVTQVLSILLLTTATSASIERANSALRHVKTDFRSMMGEERLNALILVYIH